MWLPKFSIEQPVLVNLSSVLVLIAGIAAFISLPKEEWSEELERITSKTKELLNEKPDLLISVYTFLDRVQHFHWGEDYVIEWYEKLDKKIQELIFDTNFIEDGNQLIVMSDHGFCSFGEARIQTLPEETEYGKLKGDHHEEAVLLTVNIDTDIKKPQDIFYTIR